MKRPFFSLITPVYNIERLLPATIESALSQTFSDWEMILVDDGSPDNAGKICDVYVQKDERIKVVHKQNEGLAAARNTGIKECNGKYFLILEGSDVFPNQGVLQKIYETLKENEVDIYFGKLQDVLEKDMSVINEQTDYCVNGLFKDGGQALFCKLYDSNDVLALSSPVNKLFKTDFVKENQLWFYKGIYHDDDEWIPRTIVLSKSAFFTNDIIYGALTWDGCFGQMVSDRALAKKASDKMLLAEHCCQDIEERFPQKDLAFKKKFFEYYVRIFLSGVSSLNQITSDEYKLQVKESIKKHEQIFKFMSKCESKNLKMLAFFKKILGVNIATKLILRRYA